MDLFEQGRSGFNLCRRRGRSERVKGENSRRADEISSRRRRSFSDVASRAGVTDEGEMES